MTRPYHLPVLLDEVVRYLDPKPGDIVVDGTAGGGGHALRLGELVQPNGTIILIDQDPEALQEAREKLESRHIKAEYWLGNFRSVRSMLSEHRVPEVDVVLFDLGVSSHQLDQPDRGFSFRSEAPLDMRMDPNAGSSAMDLLARLPEREISRIISEYSGEKWAVRIARFISEARGLRPIRTTTELADLVSAAIPKGAHPPDTHPATRTFQALRVAVNDELGALQEGLAGGIESLKSGGRIAAISYQSLEDRIVKQTFARYAGACQCPPGLPVCVCGAREQIKLLTRKPVVPTELEIRGNPRARSAKLRAAVKV